MAATPELETVHHIFAQRRSGHHAYIEWLEGGFDEIGVSYTHINNVCRWYPGPDAPREIIQRAEGAKVLIVNYEDVAYSERLSTLVYTGLRKQLEERVEHKDTIFMRDWYNLAASRLFKLHAARAENKYVPIQDVSWDTVRRHWLEHGQIANFNDVLDVKYNHWFTDPTYRGALTKFYDLPAAPDSSLQKVASIGKGSSFTGLSYNDSAQNMNVLERWRDLPNALLPEYKNLIKYPEIDELNMSLYGWGSRYVLDSLASQSDRSG